MPYIVQADLLADLPNDVLVQLTDDDKDGISDTTVVNNAIDRAQSEVDGYVATKYSVPLASPSEFIKGLTATIAIYRLFGRRVGGIPDAWQTRYDNAIKSLRDIASGKITLGEDPPPAESSKSTQGETSGPSRVFDRDKMGSF